MGMITCRRCGRKLRFKNNGEAHCINVQCGMKEVKANYNIKCENCEGRIGIDQFGRLYCHSCGKREE